jgi:hypothetical protein
MEGREEQRRVAEKLRTVSGKPRKVTLTQLTREITLPNGTKIIEEALDPDSLGQFCADDFEYRLHLTETSPCMMNPLLDDLGYLGITDESKELLNGLYSPPIGINDHTRSYLDELSWVNQAAINTPQDMFTKYSITTEEHIAGWKWAKERTAPGYSGITTAHWKAACLDPTLAAIDAAWANYPYVTGYSPKRWRNGVDLMIPKKTNNTRVENLRPIVLFEVDCNQNHKRLGRQVMRLAELRVNSMVVERDTCLRSSHSTNALRSISSGVNVDLRWTPRWTYDQTMIWWHMPLPAFHCNDKVSLNHLLYVCSQHSKTWSTTFVQHMASLTQRLGATDYGHFHTIIHLKD